MRIRSARERAFQTLAYEAGGLAVITPLYGLVVGVNGWESLLLLACVATACMAWSAIHNTAFDCVEAFFTDRVASERTQALRMAHAGSHEFTSILVTTPLIMLVAGYSLWQALFIDLGLTIAYTAYAYVFHITYDRLRPVCDKTVGKSFGAGRKVHPTDADALWTPLQSSATSHAKSDHFVFPVSPTMR